MAFGNFAGGFAKGYNQSVDSARNYDLGRKKLQLLQSQQQAEIAKQQTTDLNKIISGGLKSAQAIIDGTNQKIMATTDPKEIERLTTIRDQALQHISDRIEPTIGAAAQQGLPFQPGQFKSQIDNLTQFTPTPKETTSNKATVAGAVSQAQETGKITAQGDQYTRFGAYSPSTNKQFTAFDNGKGQIFMNVDGKLVPAPNDSYPVGTQVQGSKEQALGTKTQSDLQSQVIQGKDSLAQLDQLSQSFDPSYLTLPKQALMAGLKGAAKLGIELSPENQKKVADYAVFQQDSITQINKTIHDLTGAQMNQYESGRIRKQTPDPEKDDPITFKAKMDNQIKQLKLAVARHNFFLKNGIDFNFSNDNNPPISIDQMGSMIEQSIRDEIKSLQEHNPQMDDTTAKKLAIQRAKAEYGL